MLFKTFLSGFFQLLLFDEEPTAEACHSELSAFDTPVSAVYLVCICCSADYINFCVYKHFESVQKAVLNGIFKPASVLFLLFHL